jgi:lipopolysaccharide/colanic/teichoic acid biosynthesis glycosyltransferase
MDTRGLEVAPTGFPQAQFVPVFLDEEELLLRPSEAEREVPASKRVLDLLCILVGLPVILPLMLGIAALIKIVSPGPAFFSQERVGFRERRFRLLKFRSMKINAETRSHESHTIQLFRSNRPMVKMDHEGDPRLIPLGWVLRSTGLDELPQLINVLRGEMSLVGPRPCTSYEYEVLLPWHKRRFDVLPGLTGLWQVSGKNKTTFSQMISFDVQYARIWSVRFDLRIMFRTFPVLWGQLREMVEKRRGQRARAVSTSRVGAVGL